MSRDNPRLVKAKKQLIEIGEEVIARGRGVKAQIDMLQEKPSWINRLGEQLGGWLERTEKIVEQTGAVLKGHLSLPPG